MIHAAGAGGFPLVQIRNAAVVLQAAGILGSCTTRDDGPSAGPESAARGDLNYVLNDLRLNPQHREAADAYCRVVFRNDPGDDRVTPLLAGLLNVEETKAQQTLCLALVEATAAGDLDENEMSGFQEQSGPNFVQLGTLLRKVLAAHLRLQGQTAFQTEVSPAAKAG
ncbi:hypothetical protein [Pelagibius sp.]|uniref:hypothetical protein n=1 Tax=Pelagibius sp. TaxID=1931238 RepID=UPI002638760E|nr:hypothetical protein [Pelagibius sp.]